MGTTRKSSGKRTQPATATAATVEKRKKKPAEEIQANLPNGGKPGRTKKAAPVRKTITLTREEDELLESISLRDRISPTDLLHDLVHRGLEHRRVPLTSRQSIRYILDMIRRYKCPVELRAEHWHYRE